MAVAASGCSVMTQRSDGPRAYGLVLQHDVALSKGVCRRIASPGVSLRLMPNLWGVSVGWYELLSFHPVVPAGGDAAVAVLTRSYGVDAGARGLLVGGGHEFIVPTPQGSHVMQGIRFRESRLVESVVWRREFE
jgi:hypothetical protein